MNYLFLQDFGPFKKGDVAARFASDNRFKPVKLRVNENKQQNFTESEISALLNEGVIQKLGQGGGPGESGG